MSSTPLALAHYLATQVSGGTVGTDLFAGTLPDTRTGPRAATAVRSSPVGRIERVFGGVAFRLARVQVVVRLVDFEAAMARAEMLAGYLEAMPAGIYSGRRLAAVNPLGPPGLIDDDNGLVVVGVNIEVWESS